MFLWWNQLCSYDKSKCRSFYKKLRYENSTSDRLSSFSLCSYLTKLPVHMWYLNYAPPPPPPHTHTSPPPRCLYELHMDQEHIYFPSASSENKKRWPSYIIHQWPHTGLHLSPMIGTNGALPLIGTIREPEGRLESMHCLNGNLR